MNRFLIGLILLIFGCQPQQNTVSESGSDVLKMDSETLEKNEQLRHIVLFKFKDTATEENVKEVEKAFAALPAKIKEINNFEWGINNSPEGLDKGFTHCFLLTFDSEEDRSNYLPHPDHKAFGEILGPFLDDVLVIDYWAND